jgi:hypothetical protein
MTATFEQISDQIDTLGHSALEWKERALAAEEFCDAVAGLLWGIPAEAISSLELHQRQLDMDGVMVGVSRQAVDEVVGVLKEVRELLAASKDSA